MSLGFIVIRDNPVTPARSSGLVGLEPTSPIFKIGNPHASARQAGQGVQRSLALYY